jgi:hypothetical protein
MEYRKENIMKTGKKILLLALVVILAASTVLAFTGPGKWVHVKKGQDVTVNLGDAGVSITDSFYTGTVNVYRKDVSVGYKAPKHFQFTSDVLGVKFYDSNWNRVQVVTGAVYVFFNLSPWEQKALSQDRLDIYYWDTRKGNWKVCPTFAVNDGQRAGCRIRNFGEYALMFRDP